MASASQFELSPPPSDGVTAVTFAPNDSSRLLVASWDRQVYYYKVEDSSSGNSLIQKYDNRAPILDLCFGSDENEAFLAGVDQSVSRLDLESGDRTSLKATHTAGVCCVVYCKEQNILVTASWDKSLNLFNLSQPDSEPIRISLDRKPLAMAASPSKIVVAMIERSVFIYDINAIAKLFSSGGTSLEPWQKRESSLQYQTRRVACMPNDAGYATSSIEGRVAIEWFEDTAESQARKYAFKCHRQPVPDGAGDIIYPVNALAFHPIHGTFASGGGDGTVALWDAEAKRRLKQYQKFPNSVWRLAFSNDGKFLAIGVCPGFETGQEDYSGAGATSILIRELGENEAKGKGAKVKA